LETLARDIEAGKVEVSAPGKGLGTSAAESHTVEPKI
jgi:hypothetical protein